MDEDNMFLCQNKRTKLNSLQSLCRKLYVKEKKNTATKIDKLALFPLGDHLDVLHRNNDHNNSDKKEQPSFFELLCQTDMGFLGFAGNRQISDSAAAFLI